MKQKPFKPHDLSKLKPAEPGHAEAFLATLPQTGKPGFSSTLLPDAPGFLLAYRDEEGKLVAASKVVRINAGRYIVANMGADKSRGDLTGIAAMALIQRHRKIGVITLRGQITREAASLVNYLRMVNP